MAKKTNKHVKTSAGGNDAVAHMNNALLAEYGEIKDLVVRADRQDLPTRYEIAVHCRAVCEGDGRGSKYGDRAVAKLAQALGWPKSNVYEYANVAKSWQNKQAFDAFVAQDDKYGKPLSWSHIVLLASVAKTERRDKLAEEARTQGWNVRELRKKLRTDTPAVNGLLTTADPQPKMPRVLAAAVQNLVTQVAALKSNAAAFVRHLVKVIQEANPADLSDALEDQLTTARHKASEMHSEMIKQLDECLDQIQQRRSLALRQQSDSESRAGDQSQDMVCDKRQSHMGDALMNVTPGPGATFSGRPENLPSAGVPDCPIPGE